MVYYNYKIVGKRKVSGMKRAITELRSELLLLMVFTTGGIFGFIYELLFYRIDLGHFVKRGITFGPWIPIYGFGAVLVVLTTSRMKASPLRVFTISALGCGGLELAAGFLLKHLMGLRLGDYNVEIWNWGNIGGYICARSVLFFGASALLLQYVIYPFLERLSKRCSEKGLIIVAVVPGALFVLDILMSLLYAAMRQGMLPRLR